MAKIIGYEFLIPPDVPRAEQRWWLDPYAANQYAHLGYYASTPEFQEDDTLDRNTASGIEDDLMDWWKASIQELMKKYEEN